MSPVHEGFSRMSDGVGSERFVELSGCGPAWVYDVPGPSADAPALLLVHGLGVTAHLTWGASYSALARHFRVVALDLPGHGRGIRTRRFDLEVCADHVVSVLDALGLERAVVVGYSLGGPVAKLVWRRHRNRVAGLVLAATAAQFGRGRRARLLRSLLPLVSVLARLRPERVRELLVRRAHLRLEQVEQNAELTAEFLGHDPVTLVQAIRAASRFSSKQWLAEIDVPVAVMVTAADDRIAPRNQRMLAAAIARARVFEVEGPHTACATRPESFVPAFVEACRYVWDTAGSGQSAFAIGEEPQNA